jgi:hypothetical protein
MAVECKFKTLQTREIDPRNELLVLDSSFLAARSTDHFQDNFQTGGRFLS